MKCPSSNDPNRPSANSADVAHARRAASLFAAVCVLLLASFAFAQSNHTTPHVVVLHLDDTIQPISEDYLDRGLAEAAQANANAILIDLNTPGGLLTTTRSMVSKILASPVPVIVFVAPSGSRAGSAGFFLLEAADIAAMAPGTNAGASHPVVEIGKLGPIMKQKLENDTTAFLRSYVTRRNRNVDASREAVLNSKSYTDQEALQLHLIDLIAPNDRALLDSLDGRTVTRFNGSTVVLHTRGAVLTTIEPTLRESILDRLMDPNLAVLILIIGALLIYLEFNSPGTIIPGALGTLLLLTSLFALNLLPIRYTALMLIIGAFVLLMLEVKFPSHGILASAGIIALIFGTLTLVNGPIPEMRVHPATAIASGLGFGLVTSFLVRIAWRARKYKSMLGPQALIGATGIAQQPIAPHGQILIHGELWQAESTTPISSGEPVRIREVRGLMLLVERVTTARSTPD
ncbi:MAG TPA: nodulation protein NfeD [Acidobacteriaceae bacterium]|nr:nodulation protein NfeD [Acidobacteriaceae bacterium]